jgi:hypothetical protein
MRNGLLAVVAVLLAGVLIAVFVSNGDSPPVKTRTQTVTVSTPGSPTVSDNGPVTATLPLLATNRAHGARGTVTVQMMPRSRFKLTVKLSVPQKSYGIALWSNRNKYSGLYTGYRGDNNQTLVVGASRLMHYRWLAVGQTVVTTRIRHVRVGGRVVRQTKQSVANRHLLRLSNGRLLSALLAQAASR